VGAFIGERLGDRVLRRADASVRADPGLEIDLRRWKSLVRQIVAQRAALTGSHRQAPFRREAEATCASSCRSSSSCTSPRA
jgi:hypothetical protein